MAEQTCSGHSLRTIVMVTCALSLLAATLCTGARLAVKISTLGIRIHLEDYFSAAAWGFLVALNGLVIAAASNGLGESDEHCQTALEPELIWIIAFIWSPTMLAAKTTLSLQFSRFFCPTRSGRVWWANTVLMWFNILWILGAFLSIIVPCARHLPNGWTSDSSKNCEPEDQSGPVVVGSLNVLADLLLLILPIWATSRLKVPRCKRMEIVSVFSIGVFALVCSAFRLAYSVVEHKSTYSSFEQAKVVMWADAELVAIVIVTCVPVLPKFWRIFIRKQPPSPDKFTAARTFRFNYEINSKNRTHRDEIESELSFPGLSRPLNETAVCVTGPPPQYKY